MIVTASHKNDTLVLYLTGKLEFESRKPLQAALDQSLGSNTRKVSLNFSQVSFVNSAGLGVLLLTYKALQEDRIQMTLEIPEGYVLKVMNLAKIGETISIIPVETQPSTMVLPQKSTVSTIPPKPLMVFESSDMQDLLLPILEKIETQDLDLPTLPQVTTQILALTTDPKASVDQLTRMIQQDPALTAKIFQLTRSAAYGTRHAIESLPQAVAYLGLNSVSGLAFALSVQSGVFNDRGYEKEVRSLWAHAIATAFYAKTLAEMIEKNQEIAFLSGLLHSIGKLFVVHTVNHHRPTSALPLPWSTMVTLMEHSYIEVGRQLAEAWNFPPPVKEAINLHNHYSYHLATDPSKCAALTCLAKHLATYHVNAVVMPEEMLRVLPVVEALQIPQGAMDEILKIKTVIQKQIDSLLI